MARRRRRFHRTAPDRGWIVGAISNTLNMGAQPVATQDYTLFDFADIDPEALTGRIEQDKSDWFVKRVILNLWTSASLDGLTEADTVRLAEWGVGTIGLENATALETDNNPIIGPEAYNLWARLFQTGVIPVYHPGVVPYAVSNPSNTFGLNVVDGSGTTVDEAGWGMLGPFWGPAMRTYDFTVSNAGLRNNQACVFAMSLRDDIPVLYGWDQGDQLRFALHYQVLVQKRRT